MPDTDGRFDFKDGISYANAFFGIKGQMDDATRKAKKKEYAGKLLANEQVDREASGFDYDTFLQAHVDVVSEQLRDGQLDAMRQQKNQRSIDQGISMAQQQLDAGDEQGALQAILPLYDAMPNGIKIKGASPDGKSLVMEKNGEEFLQPMPTAQQALAMARGMSQQYTKIDNEFRTHKREINLKNLAKREIWVAQDGTPAYHFAMIMPDGSVQENWKDIKTGKTLHGLDPSSSEFVDSGKQFLPFEYYKEQQSLKNANKTGASIDARTASTKSSHQIAEAKAPLEREQIKSRTALNQANVTAKKSDSSGKTSKARSQRLKVQKTELDEMLRPFTGNKAGFDEEGNLTDEGKTAMDSAMRLVGKYRRKEQLKPDERDKMKYALRAVKKFQQINDDIVNQDKSGAKKKATWRDVTPDVQQPSPATTTPQRSPMTVGY